jgi:hypothetical protein
MKSTPLKGIEGMGRFVVVFCLFFALCARAHEPSKSYFSLTLASGQFTGHLDIPLLDLRNVVPFGVNKNGSVTSDQMDARYRDVTMYVLSHLRVVLDGHVLAPQFSGATAALEDFSDGQYLHLDFVLEQSSAPRTLEITYQLFFETNSLHRGLFRLESGGKTQMAVFSPSHPSQSFQFGPVSSGQQFLVFLREGVWHIWTGYDHILFLLALLLPSVLRREAGQWNGVGAFRPAFWNVLKIVSAFTVAHSITLTVAALGLVKLPSRLTESAIAFSVVLAAANNLWPLVRERGWMVAFGFGLVHGFGFATALSDFGLAHERLALTLVAFNMGVEIGQLAIVAAFLPLAFVLRRTWFYQIPLLRLGSACVILVAGAWCMERMLDLKFAPF